MEVSPQNNQAMHCTAVAASCLATRV